MINGLGLRSQSTVQSCWVALPKNRAANPNSCLAFTKAASNHGWRFCGSLLAFSATHPPVPRAAPDRCAVHSATEGRTSVGQIVRLRLRQGTRPYLPQQSSRKPPSSHQAAKVVAARQTNRRVALVNSYIPVVQSAGSGRAGCGPDLDRNCTKRGVLVTGVFGTTYHVPRHYNPPYPRLCKSENRRNRTVI